MTSNPSSSQPTPSSPRSAGMNILLAAIGAVAMLVGLVVLTMADNGLSITIGLVLLVGGFVSVMLFTRELLAKPKSPPPPSR